MAKQNACKKCGAQLAPGAKFCPACGAKTKKPPVILGVIVIVIVVAITAVVVSALQDRPETDPSPSPAAPAASAPAAAPASEPTAPPSAAPTLLAENAHVSVTFDSLYEDAFVEGVCYLKLAITNNWDKEIWTYLDKASVNGEMLPAVMQGVPTYILPGKTSSNPFILSYQPLSIDSIDQIEAVEFDIVIADRESLDEISRIPGVRIEP
jgi:hypothetical protein